MVMKKCFVQKGQAEEKEPPCCGKPKKTKGSAVGKTRVNQHNLWFRKDKVCSLGERVILYCLSQDRNIMPQNLREKIAKILIHKGIMIGEPVAGPGRPVTLAG